MPYPFAHPAAVLPLVPLMGRFAVPSALVIGSMVPDAWYFVPALVRGDSHSVAGLLWFCLPVGLLLYAAYHLLRHGALPAVPRHAVVLSVLAGALTHLGWDALAHSYVYQGFHVLQHASTLLGTVVIVWWYYRRLWPAVAAGVLLAGVGAAAIAFSADLDSLRGALRSAFVTASWSLALCLAGYWTLRSARATAPRAPRAPSPRKPGR